MEFQIRTPELARALARVQGVVEKKTTMPILANVLIKSQGKDAITVSATDLEIALTADYEAKVKTTGGISVGAKALFDIVRALPDGTATLKSETNGWVVITSGKVRYRVIGLNTETFPQLPKFDDVPFFDIEAKLLRLMIEMTLPSISTDETRFNLTGAFCEPMAGSPGMRMVATDGHRLALVERPLVAPPVMGGAALIPRKGLLEAKKLIEAIDGNARLGFVENSAVLETGSVRLTMRLIDGKFPDVSQVIPSTCAATVRVLRRSLLEGLKRMALLSPDKSSLVRFDIERDLLKLSSNNPDMGEASEEIEAVFPGEKMKIGLSYRYVVEALQVLSCERVDLDLNDDQSPLVIRGVDLDGFKSIIMPMRL